MKNRFLNNNKGNVLTIVLVITGLVLFFVLTFAFKPIFRKSMLRNFTGTQTALIYLQNHPRVFKEMGAIKDWSVDDGYFTYDKNSGKGYVVLSVKGTSASGKVRVNMFNYYNHPWRIDSAAMMLDSWKVATYLESPADWYGWAMDYLDQVMDNEAKQVCNLLQKAVPEDEYGEYCLGEIAYLQGRDDEYIEHYQKLVQRDQNDDVYNADLAKAYRDIGKYDKSAEFYTKSWTLRPTLKTAANLAYVKLLQNDLNSAYDWLQRARSFSPDGSIKDYYLAYYYGWYFLIKKDFIGAMDYFNLARKLNPNDDKAYFGLAYCYEDQNKPGMAKFYYEQGLARNPTNSLAKRRDLAKLLLKNNYTDEAIYHLRQLISYHPREIMAYFLLAGKYRETGRSALADYYLELAKKINPTEFNRILNGQ